MFRKPVVIKPDTKELWEVRGWKRNGSGELTGYYRTRHGAYAGRITEKDLQFFITNPPESLLNGPKGMCFFRQGKETWHVHWHTQPTDISGGIVAMETLLNTARRVPGVREEMNRLAQELRYRQQEERAQPVLSVDLPDYMRRKEAMVNQYNLDKELLKWKPPWK